LSGPEGAGAALASVASIPRDAEGPVFPAPWAARAFALAVALNERGLFTWREWSEALGAAVARTPDADAADPEAYWRAWLAALEEVLASKKVAEAADLRSLQEAWRRAAEATPHGHPIELSAGSAPRKSFADAI
jgi:nitrile hydratase accessory protein